MTKVSVSDSVAFDQQVEVAPDNNQTQKKEEKSWAFLISFLFTITLIVAFFWITWDFK